MAVTLKDISERVGLSYPTVAQVLGNGGKGTGRYRQETRDRIRKVAAELGYRPHIGARATATGRFNTIALILSTEVDNSYLPPALLSGIHARLAAASQRLLVSRFDDAALCDREFVPQLLRESCADGMLVDYTHSVPAPLEQIIEEFHLPSIWLNNKRPTDAVYPDEFGLGAMAVERFMGLGHRRIAMLMLERGRSDFHGAHYHIRDRVNGFEQAAQDAGLAPWTIMFNETMPAADRLDWAIRFVRSPERPTAVFCYAGDEAGVLYTAARIAGLRVPEDLSIILPGGDAPLHDVAGVPITTLTPPTREMGVAAVDMLMGKIEAGETMASRVVSYGWAEGTSCGPVPHG